MTDSIRCDTDTDTHLTYILATNISATNISFFFSTAEPILRILLFFVLFLLLLLFPSLQSRSHSPTPIVCRSSSLHPPLLLTHPFPNLVLFILHSHSLSLSLTPFSFISILLSFIFCRRRPWVVLVLILFFSSGLSFFSVIHTFVHTYIHTYVLFVALQYSTVVWKHP